MKKNKIISSLISLTLAFSMMLAASSCKDNNTESNSESTSASESSSDTPKETISNEETPLVVSTEALDAVFNPFFYTTGADGDVIGQTQIGMLSTDEKGNVVCGENEPCVVENYTNETVGTQEDNKSGSYDSYYTDYWFAIKKGIKFSDGTDLTINDVLFNLYVLLDSAYTGSSTLYSTDIKGLKAYRAQTEDESQQDEFDSYYRGIAADRIALITEWCKNKDSTLSDLDAIDETCQAETPSFSIISYIDKAKEMFKEELNSDWNTASTSIEDYKKYGFTETWQVFLSMEGLITFDNDKAVKDTPAAVQWNGNDKLTDYSQVALVNKVYSDYIGAEDISLDTYKSHLEAITSGGWATASNLLTYIKSKAIQEALGGQKTIKSISGITTENSDSIGSTKKIALYENHDILKIRVNGVDPKAIYNFSFTVAPMHYYSTDDEIAKFNIAEGNFGVSLADTDFFEKMQKKQVPVGAGPYKATNDTTSATKTPAKSEFWHDNIVYMERNNYFYTVGSGLNNAKIKKLRYKVIATTQLFDAVTGNAQEVLYASPSAKQAYIQNLKANSKCDYTLPDNLGYGYIGINAGKIPNIHIRRAIMYAMNTQLCLDYYKDSSLATIINRPMTSNSWAYPAGCTAYYPFDDSTDSTKIKQEVSEAGYSLDSSGKYKNSEGDTLKFTFTIAGDSTDHPAYAVMKNAEDILNKLGSEVTTTTDANALKKLANGNLEVWAAAWSSTIDPDMYQVYHKDSKASSVKNWGYTEIFNVDSNYNYSEEQEIIGALSDNIEKARKILNESSRADIYHTCLDEVMELAVELPTYQRKNLFVWNKTYINSSSLANATAFQSPLSKIWEVSFNETK